MRISTNWINDYVDISDENLHELAKKITNAGVNVESVIEFNNPNLVVGQITEVENHPDSDHLHVCKVDVGDEILQIVCGANNVRENLKVIVSKIGCTLPGDVEIKKSTIRGVTSFGMLCALSELGLEEDTPENHAKGICELPDDALIGSNPYNYLGYSDIVYDLDLNPNREADCTNHIGFAYEVSAVLGKKIELPESNIHPIERSINDELSIDVITDNCTMYNARKVVDVVIKESPSFIKERLINAGMRPINNVVDISNYVMLEYGQPLHFFDADKLGNEILVRMAEKGEKITTLDHQNRVLTKDDIVITDGEKPVCIAGVMGGLDSGIDENTKNVVIESAIFDPLKIRYTSIRLDLKSEASRRYEHGLNYEYTEKALDRACYLLEKYADAKVLSDTISYDNTNKEPKVATVTLEKINSLLSLELSVDTVKEIFDRLGFPCTVKGTEFTVKIPNRRSDVQMREDLVEEVGRLYGYEHIESKMPTLAVKRGKYKGNIGLRKKVSKYVRSLGLDEVRTYTLINPSKAEMFNYNFKNNITLLKPMSNDKSVVRQSLITSLIDVYEYNKARGFLDVNIYEIAKTYCNIEEEDEKVSFLVSGKYFKNLWQNNCVKSDFYVLKGIVVQLLNYLGFENRVVFEKNNTISNMHPGMCAIVKIDGKEIGFIGRVHPSTASDEVYVGELSLNKILEHQVRGFKVKTISKYPTIVKDVSFVMKKNIESITVENEIKKCAGSILSSVEVFDLYEGDTISNDEKAIAYSLIFSSNDRTLNNEEVNESFDKIIKTVSKKLNVRVRN